MSTAPDIRIELKSDPNYLAGARDLVSAVARRLGFSDEASGQIALALDEALANVIRHGYDKRTDAPIWISLWPVRTTPEGGIRIVIEDEARQVDPDKIKGRDLEEVRPGGLGVHIIREVMDEVTYEKREHKGMRLTMVKRVPAAEPAPKGAAPGPAAGGGAQS